MKSNPEVHWFFYTEVFEGGKRLFKGGPHGKTGNYALVQPRLEDLKAVMQAVRKSGLLTDYMPSIKKSKPVKQALKPKPEPKPKPPPKTVDWRKPKRLKDGRMFIPLNKSWSSLEAVTVKLGKPHLKVIVEDRKPEWSGWYCKDVVVTDVGVIQGRKKLWVRGYHSKDDELEAKQLKELLSILKKAKRIICYRFHMLDMFRTVEEFIAWIDENKYHFENADFMDEKQGTTFFHGNLKEYSAAFSMRFFDKTYSNKIKKLVKNRGVKCKIPLCYEIPWQVCDKIKCDQCVIPKVKLCRNCKLRKRGQIQWPKNVKTRLN
jgi:hypothetical protein